MSDDQVTFEDIIYHLQNNPDGATRAEAAQVLGDYVEQLSDGQYDIARQALNVALADPDPAVIMAAMMSLSRYQRGAPPAAAMDAVADQAEEAASLIGGACAVCGKPEMLIDGATCEEPNCPYR